MTNGIGESSSNRLNFTKSEVDEAYDEIARFLFEQYKSNKLKEQITEETA